MSFDDVDVIAHEAAAMTLLEDREGTPIPFLPTLPPLDGMFPDMPFRRAELVFKLLRSLPRSQLARIHRKIGPLLLLDVIGVSTRCGRSAIYD